MPGPELGAGGESACWKRTISEWQRINQAILENGKWVKKTKQFGGRVVVVDVLEWTL